MNWIERLLLLYLDPLRHPMFNSVLLRSDNLCSMVISNLSLSRRLQKGIIIKHLRTEAIIIPLSRSSLVLLLYSHQHLPHLPLNILRITKSNNNNNNNYYHRHHLLIIVAGHVCLGNQILMIMMMMMMYDVVSHNYTRM